MDSKTTIDKITELFHSDEEVNKLLAIQLIDSQDIDTDKIVKSICTHPEVDHTTKIHVIDNCEFFAYKGKLRKTEDNYWYYQGKDSKICITFVCNDRDMGGLDELGVYECWREHSKRRMSIYKYQSEYERLMKIYINHLIEKNKDS